MIVYKIDVLEELDLFGYTPAEIRKQKLLSEVTLQRLQNKEPISMKSLDTICRLLELQPGHILRYVPDEK